MTQTTFQIYSAMVAIMRDMDGIAKAQVNSHQRYQYRGIDDLYNHCHSILAKHGVFCLPEVLKCEREAIETAGGKSAVSTLVTVEKLKKVNQKIEEVSDSPLVNPWH